MPKPSLELLLTCNFAPQQMGLKCVPLLPRDYRAPLKYLGPMAWHDTLEHHLLVGSVYDKRRSVRQKYDGARRHREVHRVVVRQFFASGA